jgi:hypothetical protein
VDKALVLRYLKRDEILGMIAACDAGLTEALGRFSVSMKSSFSFPPSIGVNGNAFGVSMMVSDKGMRFRWTGAILHAIGWIYVSPTISGAYDQYMAHMMPLWVGIGVPLSSWKRC